MEESILTGTKKILGLAEDYTAFDHDITIFINDALSTAEQAGAGLAFVSIEDATSVWADLGLTPKNLALLKNYVYLKVRMLFDTPPTSFAIDAMKAQIEEKEYRMRTNTEVEEATA